MKIGANDRAVSWLLTLLAILPAAGALLFIRQFGVNLHFFDEWMPDIAGLLVKAHHHEVAFSDLFAQHNEHRILVPRLVLLLTNPVTHWNARAVMEMEWGFIAATSLIVLYLIKKTRAGSSPGALAIWFLCNLLMFTPQQYENLLWGMGLANVMPAFFVMLGIAVAISGLAAGPRLVICLFSAVAATYSSGNGILALPLVGILLVGIHRENESRLRWPIAAVWIFACVLILASYFSTYTKPSSGGNDSTSNNPVNIALYTVTFLGGPFAHGLSIPPNVAALIAGSILLIIYLAASGYWFFSRSRNQLLPWLMVGGFAIFSGLIAARYRAGSGTGESLVSRYISFSVYLPVALANLVPIITAEQFQRDPVSRQTFWKFLPASLGIALLIPIGFTVLPAVNDARTIHGIDRQAKGVFLLAKIFPDDTNLIAPISGDYAQTLGYALDLGSIGYLQPPLLSSDDAEKIRATDPAEISRLTGELDVATRDASQHPIAAGWAIDTQTMQNVDSVFLTYDAPGGQSIIFAVAQMNANRGDIARAKGNPAYEWSGWVAPLQVDRLPKDRKSFLITAWILDADSGQAVQMPGQITFNR
jgi:hypothetical protein